MEEYLPTPAADPVDDIEATDGPLDAQPDSDAMPAIEETSAAYLGQWNRLVSTTNWEKGRIICQWREAVLAAGAPAASCSDEAWSRRVGSVTPQHVGRLRRVHQRFGEVQDQYAGLYWSHFQAALDWPDAEMWLEGAVQNDWSVARMRHQRWEAFGALPDERPRDADIVVAERDEDYDPADALSAETVYDAPGTVRDAGADASDLAGTDAEYATDATGAFDEPATAPIRPFQDLPPLPPDLDEAFEALKLAILHHKVSGWQEIARDDVLAVIESLRQLALAPAAD